ncbi:MAG: hypothetical protein K2Q09_11750, partial [Phycisphaerales bacterium]|nr:hypothetical protein [Phycisphaerales bacterium]
MLNLCHSRLFLSAVAGLAAASPALAQVRVCAWNVTNYSTTSTARNGSFQTALYGVVPAGLALAGQSMSPDVIIGQEFTSAAAVTNFRALLNSAPGSPGDWAAAPYLNGNDSDSAFFYRTSKVQFINRWRISIGGAAPEPPRDTLRYDFRPLGYTADSTVIS